MDLRKLKTILDLFENSTLTEIEFSEGEEKVRLKKGGAPAASSAAVAPAVAPAPPPAPAPAASPAPAAESAPAEEAASGTIVKSPMVGTFYRAPASDRPPFARVGQRVAAGETLCIVEAMKLMNEIPSPVAGVIKEILIENAVPVAYGEPLFVIE